MLKTAIIAALVLSITGIPSGNADIPEINFTVEQAAAEIVQEEQAPRYWLTDAERAEICGVVMSEAGHEDTTGQKLVAQCILNACETNGIRPAEALDLYHYANRSEPTEEVRESVSAVFDAGEEITGENILFFYSPRWMKGGYSAFHESQNFVIEHGGHRFFSLKE